MFFLGQNCKGKAKLGGAQYLEKNCFDVIIFAHTTSKAVEYFFCGVVVVIGATIHKIMQVTSQVFMYREVQEFPCKKLDT